MALILCVEAARNQIWICKSASWDSGGFELVAYPGEINKLPGYKEKSKKFVEKDLRDICPCRSPGRA